MPNRIINYNNNIMISVTFELSLSLEVHDRQVYGILDILSGIGGLYGGLRAICFFIVSTFQYRGSHMFMMRDMFNSKMKGFKKMNQLEK